MKNLFRIYLNGIRSVQKLFVLLLVLIRIAIFSLHAIFENGSSTFYERALWNVHIPFLIALIVMQTFFLVYRRKELTLLPETNRRKYDSMILYIGLHYVAMSGVLIGVHLLLSPFVSVKSLADFVITAPADGLLLLLFIALFNVVFPLLINNLLLSFSFNSIIVFWIVLSWMQNLVYLDRGIFAANPWVMLLFLAGIVACWYLGQYCFNRRAVCDHKLLNL